MFNRLFNSAYTLEASSGNVQSAFQLNLHIGDVQWECSTDFSPQPTHWRRPLGLIEWLFVSTYTLGASSGNDQSIFHLSLHIGGVQWECSSGFSTQLTHWSRPLGPIEWLFVSTYTLGASSGNVQSAFQLSLHTGSVH